MPYAARSSPVAIAAPLAIRTCSHLLQRGSLCRGAAVRGKSYCRHHLLIRVRLRKMARARRRVRGLGALSLTSAAAIDHAQVRMDVAFAAGRIDPASVPTLLWAFQLARSVVRAVERLEHPPTRPAANRIRPPNHNRINQLPTIPFDLERYLENDS